MSDPTPCPRCGVPLQRQVLPEIEGSAGECRVKVRGLPMDVCPACGARRFPSVSFALNLALALARGHRLRPPKSKGLFNRRLVCSECGEELTPEPHPGTITIPLEAEGAAVEVEVDAPFHTCYKCGAQHAAISGGHGRELVEAVTGALKAAEGSG